MDWQGALRARLVAAAPVIALVAQRVYWVDRPQAAALPAITLQTITELREHHFLGLDGLDMSRVQIDCWSTTYSNAQAIKEAVLAALIPENTGNGIYFARSFPDSIRDFGERVETQFIHRTSIDLITHHNTV